MTALRHSLLQVLRQTPGCAVPDDETRHDPALSSHINPRGQAKFAVDALNVDAVCVDVVGDHRLGERRWSVVFGQGYPSSVVDIISTPSLKRSEAAA